MYLWISTRYIQVAVVARNNQLMQFSISYAYELDAAWRAWWRTLTQRRRSLSRNYWSSFWIMELGTLSLWRKSTHFVRNSWTYRLKSALLVSLVSPQTVDALKHGHVGFCFVVCCMLIKDLIFFQFVRQQWTDSSEVDSGGKERVHSEGGWEGHSRLRDGCQGLSCRDFSASPAPSLESGRGWQGWVRQQRPFSSFIELIDLICICL